MERVSPETKGSDTSFPNLKGIWSCNNQRHQELLPGTKSRAKQFLILRKDSKAAGIFPTSQMQKPRFSHQSPSDVLSVLALAKRNSSQLLCTLQWPETHSPSHFPRPLPDHLKVTSDFRFIYSKAQWAFLSYSLDLLLFTSSKLIC